MEERQYLPSTPGFALSQLCFKPVGYLATLQSCFDQQQALGNRRRESLFEKRLMPELGSSSRCHAATLLWLSSLVLGTHASVTIMEGKNKVYPSRPDKSLGHELWKGSDYMGRLQFVHGNLQLCKSAQDPSRRFTVTETMDGLPRK